MHVLFRLKFTPFWINFVYDEGLQIAVSVKEIMFRWRMPSGRSDAVSLPCSNWSLQRSEAVYNRTKHESLDLINQRSLTCFTSIQAFLVRFLQTNSWTRLKRVTYSQSQRLFPTYWTHLSRSSSTKHISRSKVNRTQPENLRRDGLGACYKLVITWMNWAWIIRHRE